MDANSSTQNEATSPRRSSVDLNWPGDPDVARATGGYSLSFALAVIQVFLGEGFSIKKITSEYFVEDHVLSTLFGRANASSLYVISYGLLQMLQQQMLQFRRQGLQASCTGKTLGYIL